MRKAIAKTLLVGAVMFAAAGCGYDASASFNADGSVTVGVKLLIPKSLMDPGSGAKVTGLSDSDIAAANAKAQKQYPGAKVTRFTEGDQTGVAATIPFKNENDAFAYLTKPATQSPSGAVSSSRINVDLSGSLGLFSSATHTRSGATDTYTFITARPSPPSPAPSSTPGQEQLKSLGETLVTLFEVNFALTVQHVITSAPGALFTLDRRTAIWRLTLTSVQTLTATTGGDTTLAGYVSPVQDARLVVAVGFIAVALGFFLGMFLTWRGLLGRPRPTTAAAAPPAHPSSQPASADPNVAWPAPPPQAPPPTEI